MKKLFCILIAVLLLVFGLCACRNDTQTGRTDNPSGTETNGTETPTETETPSETEKEDMELYITVGNTRLTATLEDNTATAALKEKLKTAPATVEMSDYGSFEKVGSFGFSLPTSDKQTTTRPCDFVLYQGDKLVIFYGSNSWSYTRLGKITGVSPEELKSILGSGNVSVTLSI